MPKYLAEGRYTLQMASRVLHARAFCGAALLWRQQKVARTCGVGTKPLARNAIIVGLAVGAVLFYLGYAYA